MCYGNNYTSWWPLGMSLPDDDRFLWASDESEPELGVPFKCNLKNINKLFQFLTKVVHMNIFCFWDWFFFYLNLIWGLHIILVLNCPENCDNIKVSLFWFEQKLSKLKTPFKNIFKYFLLKWFFHLVTDYLIKHWEHWSTIKQGNKFILYFKREKNF